MEPQRLETADMALREEATIEELETSLRTSALGTSDQQWGAVGKGVKAVGKAVAKTANVVGNAVVKTANVVGKAAVQGAKAAVKAVGTVVGTVFKKGLQALGCIDLNCDLNCDGKEADKMVRKEAEGKSFPPPATFAPWSSTEAVNVAMFMAFVSYNDEKQGLADLINKASSASGAVKAGGFKFDNLYDARGLSNSGVERLATYGKIRGEETVVIAYRGTAGIRDILSDLNPIQVQWDHGNRVGRVHMGMYRQFKDDLRGLHSIVKRHIAQGRRKFLTTGHSLGGALATMAARYLADEFADARVELITFGSAAGHNDAFAGEMKKAVKHRAHIVHYLDPVPCLGLKVTQMAENDIIVQFDKDSKVFHTPARRYSCAIATEFPICNAENYHIGGSYCDSVGRLFAGASPPDEACGMVGPAND